MPGVWQKYVPDLCPNAEYLQKRMVQLKTTIGIWMKLKNKRKFFIKLLSNLQGKNYGIF